MKKIIKKFFLIYKIYKDLENQKYSNFPLLGLMVKEEHGKFFIRGNLLENCWRNIPTFKTKEEADDVRKMFLFFWRLGKEYGYNDAIDNTISSKKKNEN